MVLSRKQMTPKKTMQMGGSRKQFAATATTKKAGAMHMGGSRKTKSHRESGKRETMHEVCVACHREGRKKKVRIDDVRKETFKGKGNTLRARLVGKCEHGHKWYRITKA
jgi:hypothetical protein